MGKKQGFLNGQFVRVKSLWSAEHHRVPHYLKGKIGQVISCLGHVENPEMRAYFKDNRDPYILYRVRFTHAHLWGGNKMDEIFADLAGKWLSELEE